MPTDWEALRANLGDLRLDQAIQQGVWSLKLSGLPADYAPYSPEHVSYLFFATAPFHANESKNLSDKFDQAFANAERHATDQPDKVRIVLMRIPETMPLLTCHEWAKAYLADNPDSPIDGIYLYQLAVIERGRDQSVMSYAICISETGRFQAWRSPPDKPRRVLAINLAVGIGNSPYRVEMIGGPLRLPLNDRYFYQQGNFYTVYDFDRTPVSATIKNLASGIFQHAVFRSPGGQMTLGGIFPPSKEITLFD